MPVLGAGSLATACTFLASYGVGCVLAMTMATIFIGQGTATLTQNTDFDLGKLIRVSFLCRLSPRAHPLLSRAHALLNSA